ncbi:AraC family transcriptional regulator [uncultured Acinetobacter sp.]|uniref:AraC family transcriptional regulator n=1 Tax=uncultured Acinetobacter sp. TaxID=165433 RepID=UPI0025883C99|nr:AraC family transcriptional regulator [uncultured Acinetobacter sp.]
MRSEYEKIIVKPYSSWSFLNRRMEQGIPFQWHHHPEFEFTLTVNSYGKRYIGSDISNYHENDLVMIGPNISHTWQSFGKFNPNQPYIALVIWVSTEWIQNVINIFPEMRSLNNLLILSNNVVIFSEDVKHKVIDHFHNIPALGWSERTPLLLKILLTLSQDEKMIITHVNKLNISSENNKKIQNFIEVMDYIDKNYHKKISIEDLAEMCFVSPATFYRSFKKILKKSPMEYIINLRINHAAELILERNMAIANIAEYVGYSSLALFNRHFKSIKKISPREYRLKYNKQFI